MRLVGDVPVGGGRLVACCFVPLAKPSFSTQNGTAKPFIPFFYSSQADLMELSFPCRVRKTGELSPPGLLSGPWVVNQSCVRPSSRPGTQT
jgi:hypothetical protein